MPRALGAKRTPNSSNTPPACVAELPGAAASALFWGVLGGFTHPAERVARRRCPSPRARRVPRSLAAEAGAKSQLCECCLVMGWEKSREERALAAGKQDIWL